MVDHHEIGRFHLGYPGIASYKPAHRFKPGELQTENANGHGSEHIDLYHFKINVDIPFTGGEKYPGEKEQRVKEQHPESPQYLVQIVP